MTTLKSPVPEFGPLAGVKVVNAALSVAGPTCAQVMAEWGADVVWIESPLGLDVVRTGTGLFAEQDRRNERSLCLNIPTPEGKQVLLRLIEDVDIYIEASKGGQYDRWGLSDEVLWEHNPKLVIVHISGFGQTGIEEYVTRPSYDPIAQAFGCYMEYNGFPDRPPIPACPQTADYMTGLMASSAALAALHRAEKTGKGESIDVAQFEVLIRFLNRYPIDYINEGIEYPREGDHNAKSAGFGNYTCKDGKQVYICFLGVGVYKKGCKFLGIEYGTEEFPEGTSLLAPSSKGGQILEEHLKAYVATKTAAEVEEELNKVGVPAQRVMQIKDALVHPQYIAREVFYEWETVKGRKVTGVNVMPKFKNNPGQVWRGCPTIGMDNDVILAELGFSAEEIADLYKSKTITQK